MQEILNWFSDRIPAALVRAVPSLIILLVGMIVIRIVMAVINRILKKTALEKAAYSLVRSVARTVMYIMLLLMVASALGIDVTGLVALASVITLAISLALQNSLTNLIGGFTLLHTKPFASGDFVEIAGQSGTVQEIGMAYTKLTSPDNKMIQIPNASVVATEIINYTSTGKRRVAIEVRASYAAPVDKVIEALKEAANVEGVLEDPAIFAAVTSYGDSGIHYVVRMWCSTDQYWDVYNTALYNIKKIFDREGLAMTYPHLNVHLDK